VRRRRLLGAAGAAGAAGLAGCLGALDGGGGEPTVVPGRPDAVYVPSHVEGMRMVGMETDGPYGCALAFTFPHRFWLVTGTRTERVDVADDDSVHMMPVVFDEETGIVPPDLNPQLRVTEGGEEVAQLAPWAMLSQPMGFHFGDNVALGGEGSFVAEVSVGEPSTRRTGALADNEGGARFSFAFEFAPADLEDISVTTFPEAEQGTRGAADPMAMEMLPDTTAPPAESMPGDVRATATSGDAEFVVTVLADATPFGGDADQAYLAASPRTPHSRYVLPLLTLSATLTRDGSTAFDGALPATLDPALGHHYGAVVDEVAPGDALTLSVGAPPQVARHEGYETAFLEMGPMELTL